jgi:hypothetical protein
MGHSGVPISMCSQEDSIIRGVNTGKRVGLRHSAAIPIPAPRQLLKGAGLCIRIEVITRSGKFKGCSAAEVRLNLIPQGRLNTRQ